MKRAVNKSMHGFARFALCVFVLIFGVLCMPLAACDSGGGGDDPIPAGSLRVTFNYFRPDSNYASWDMWIWPEGGNGSGYAFDEKTVELAGKKWATLTVTLSDVDLTSDKPIWFIVRKGGSSWSDKDPDGDRFVPKSKFKNGAATVYLASGHEGLYDDAQAAIDVASSHIIKAADLYNFRYVVASTDMKITDKSVFKLKDDTGNVIVTIDCSQPENSNVIGRTLLEINLESDVDISKSYELVDEPATFDKDSNFLGTKVNKAKLYTSEAFGTRYNYEGDDLGVTYTAASSTFKVWSPVASAMKLNIYDAGENGTPTTTVMTAGEKGVWSATVNGNLNGKYYTYSVTTEGTTKEVVDPYARSAGRNGKRGMILDLASTNPAGWDNQNRPALKSYSDAIIYEAQLRDLTIHESSNVTAANRGKFLGLTETEDNKPLAYIKELGVTAVHFQPLFDFASVNENFNTATYNKDGEFNWGYDPLNYNIPEGSYSSDPSDGFKRVNEMKQMIQALHNAGIQVIMDVVYNHVMSLDSSNFQALVPGYYFRFKSDGSPSNGSGCGNETASERYMFRKFMIESVCYWAEEYKIDGFRFDLMALHDYNTMNELYDAVAEINPDIMIYGEGWTGGASMLSGTEQASIGNAGSMPNIAVFDDIIRDGLKGSVFGITEIGYVSGKKANTDAAVYVGAGGGTSAVSSTIYGKLGKQSFAASPTQNINYVSCHDNSALWDKLNASVNASADVLKGMNRIAAASVLTSQGASFFLAGEELLRSKPTTETNTYDNRPESYLTDPTYFFSDNSYKSPDSVNAIDWSKATANADMVSYYKGLIALKKSVPNFRISSKETLAECVVMIDTDYSDGIAVYAVKDPDSDSYAIVMINATDTDCTVAVPDATYGVFVENTTASAQAIRTFTGSSASVKAYSATVLIGNVTKTAMTAWTYSVTMAE